MRMRLKESICMWEIAIKTNCEGRNVEIKRSAVILMDREEKDI